jgi:hypothetical protein
MSTAGNVLLVGVLVGIGDVLDRRIQLGGTAFEGARAVGAASAVYSEGVRE